MTSAGVQDRTPIQDWRECLNRLVYYPRTGDGRPSGAGDGVPVVAGAAMRQGASGTVSQGVFSDRPVAAFSKHAATTCRPVSGQGRARPLAENSILHGGAWSGWRPGERAGRGSREVADAAGRPLGETAGETGRAGRRPGSGCIEPRWCSGLVVPRTAIRRKRHTRWWRICQVRERGAASGPRQVLCNAAVARNCRGIASAGRASARGGRGERQGTWLTRAHAMWVRWHVRSAVAVKGGRRERRTGA